MTVMWCLPSTFSMGLNTSGRSMFAPAHTIEGEQMPRPMDVPYLAGIATVGWLLSGLVAAWIPAALIIILGTGFVKPLGRVQLPNNGGTLERDLRDYVGIVFVVAAIIALVQGTTGEAVISLILRHVPPPQ